MNITNFIKLLQNVKEEHGNLEVVLSCDEEGNKFSSPSKDIGIEFARSVWHSWEPCDEGTDRCKKCLFIYPD
jgi:hypothetical protein